MNYRQILGIFFIILGIIFAVYPFYSATAVSWIAGICLIAFGFASIISGFSIWSMLTHYSLIDILVGICAIIFGILFIYEIDFLSFLVAFQFYLIAFVMIIVGIVGLVTHSSISKIASLLILVMGILAIYCAVFSIAQPLFTAILVGICLIMEGIIFLTSDLVESIE